METQAWHDIFVDWINWKQKSIGYPIQCVWNRPKLQVKKGIVVTFGLSDTSEEENRRGPLSESLPTHSKAVDDHWRIHLMQCLQWHHSFFFFLIICTCAEQKNSFLLSQASATSIISGHLCLPRQQIPSIPHFWDFQVDFSDQTHSIQRRL